MAELDNMAELDKLRKYNPSREQCEKRSECHTGIYVKRTFYVFKFDKPKWGLTTHTLNSDSLHTGNILNIIENSLENGNFVSLEKVSFKEYVQAGASDVPVCAGKCEYEGDFPLCIKR